ncbi:hypothetical protein FRACYDRAFT_236606 [Fragilariopsis cylindrus CCMP1102]|uniref:Uncharacterized protein n=1 Tax=Fragilariopsis cylindrus CCMP1102 TaxID=635003 RepID=A0A1E7FJH5_9STRA|nr:hypothetical protein FRACYDRAFT_236606 [Fragilariopsis cylindrus CCMP1102]|eukprot:OEU18330.1 hypothetical protein FRACYDRAFT_236606 [Fragilariopsis cylindrus CCMP1102]
MLSSEWETGDTTKKEDLTYTRRMSLSQEGNGENVDNNKAQEQLKAMGKVLKRYKSERDDVKVKVKELEWRQGMQNSYLNSSKDFSMDKEDADLYQRKLRSKIIKTKYVNDLAHKYYAKKHLLCIFLPIQILSVWTTVSGAACAYILIMYPNSTTNDTDDRPIHETLPLLRSLLNALVGASLLILTNLSNVLQYDALSKHHLLVSAQMDELIEFVDFVAEKGGTDECYENIKEIENNFKLAFDILQSKLEVKLRAEDRKSRSFVSTTYDPMTDYSLLASFIESRINLTTTLPGSRRSAKMIDDIIDDSNASGNNNNDSNGSNDEAAGSNDNVFDEFEINNDISKFFKFLELQVALTSIKAREISYIWNRRTSNSAEAFPVYVFATIRSLLQAAET